jgi:signal transduction histidine kinase/ActR/RegA family two-component response regulator
MPTRTAKLGDVHLGESRLAILVVTVLAIVDFSAGPTVVIAGVMTVGPGLAAISGNPRSVIAVGAYSVALLALLSWPDHIWWTLQQLLYLLALLGVTAVSAAAAARRARGERLLREAEAESARTSAVSAATSEFLSRVSHELRTPLNAVLGFTELLERSELTPEQREATEQVARAGQHLLALVNDVLDVTAIEAGRLALSVEPVAVRDVMREAVELTASHAQASGISLTAELDGIGGWHVVADVRRLRQILVNLLSNAIKFNRPGGKVTVRAARDGNGGISIAVSDTGPGIAEQDLPKLFEPFERLDAALAGIEGSGMGLALSRGLAEAMGGSLTVESSKGTGTTFSVTLPETSAPIAGLAPLADQPESPPTPAIPTESARVLYIEDNLSNLRLVERILQRRPAWDLTHAAGGISGLELALATRFDLILLDQDLPDLAGLEVLRALRGSEDRADVPIVIVSADAAPGQLKRALTAGATGYLVKPFTIDGLLDVLDGQTVPSA